MIHYSQFNLNTRASFKVVTPSDGKTAELTVVGHRIYKLPKTGGIGADKIVLLEILISLTSLLLLGMERRKKRQY